MSRIHLGKIIVDGHPAELAADIDVNDNMTLVLYSDLNEVVIKDDNHGITFGRLQLMLSYHSARNFVPRHAYGS